MEASNCRAIKPSCNLTTSPLTISTGICAGKHSVEDFLVKGYGFTRLRFNRSSSDSSPSQPLLTPSDENIRTFTTFNDLYDFVTKNWNQHWVTTDTCSPGELDLLFLRPFFLLISVDAPLTLRWQRYQARCLATGSGTPELSLEDFVAQSDAHVFSPSTGLARLLDRAQVRLINTSPSLPALYAALSALDLTSEARLRPSWDAYFMQLASLAAQRSNCMKRRVGCVLVRDRRVVSTGYNGTPRNLRNCNEGGCPRCNAGMGKGHALSTCLCLHAEENALLEAGRERIREGTSLYCDTCPCLTCSIKIVQVGIAEVVYHQGYNMDEEVS